MLDVSRKHLPTLAIIALAATCCSDPATTCPERHDDVGVMSTDSAEDIGESAKQDVTSTDWTCPGMEPVEYDFDTAPFSPSEHFPPYMAATYRTADYTLVAWDSWQGSSIQALDKVENVVWEASQADDGFCGRGPIRPLEEDFLLCRSHHCTRIRKEGTIVWETPSELDSLGRVKALFASGQRHEVTVVEEDHIWAPYNRHQIAIPRDGLAGPNVALVRLDAKSGKLDRTWPQLAFPQVTAVDVTGFQWNQIALIAPGGAGTADVVGACYHHDAVRCGFVARALNDGSWTNVYTFDLPGSPTPTVGGAVAKGDGFVVLGEVKVNAYSQGSPLLHSLHQLGADGTVSRVREIPGLADPHDADYMMGPTIRLGRLDANHIYLSRMIVGTTAMEAPRPQIIAFDNELRPVWETSFKGDSSESCPTGPIVSRVDACGIDLLVQHRLVTIDHWGSSLNDIESKCRGLTVGACSTAEPCQIAQCSPTIGCVQLPILQRISCGLKSVCIQGVCKKLD